MSKVTTSGSNILDLIKCPYQKISTSDGRTYSIVTTNPATGILYVSERNPEFISGHIRVRGKDEGRYPYNYLEMIDNVFGFEPNTIEVCSRDVKPDGIRTAFTVDINPAFNPSMTADAQTLEGIQPNYFSRWRADPPYSDNTASKMYGTGLPSPIKLLNAGSRVCKIGALMFLLLGPSNYQHHPKGVKRIGLIFITVVPNNELRALNIFYKYADN